MDERNISRSAGNLIYLVACALHNTDPEKTVVAKMDFNTLYSLAQNHSVTAIACMGMEKGTAFSHCSPKLLHKWKEAKEKALHGKLGGDRKKILKKEQRRLIL